MDYIFSRRVQNLKPSAIREILKYASDPTVISLSAGNPAPEAFPVKEIAALSERILRERPVDALQYGTTEGLPSLREHLKEYLARTHGVGRPFDDILITSGAQQVMELAVKALCDEGDVILCENPSFIGSLNSFRSLGGRLRGIPTQADGIDTEALEQALREEKTVRFLYLIPNFQNPTGITMSAEKRRRVYALANQYHVLILEDNPYGDLRFEGEHVEAMKAMDENGLVIYAGTFSKVISPGMRVGYALAPKEILQKMIVCKQGEDVHTNMWGQLVCDGFLTEYDFAAHLERLRGIYREKATLAMRLLDKWLVPQGVAYHPVQGGLFLWCTLPEGVNMQAFCRRAVEHAVCVVPGTAFLPDEAGDSASFRINFSTPTDEQLEKGIRLLGECL